ncbi:MAG TPA: F0F1 ATP synthase subunit A [Gemmatimonadales bacterium]|jgi:F-type H+-transporting ATPase subunit a
MIVQAVDVGELVLHHTADTCTLDFSPFGELRIPGCHLSYPISANLSVTRHLVFVVIAALLVFLTMWYTARTMRRQEAGRRAPKGFAGAVEGLVLWVRNDIAIANIGHDGAKFAPLILTLFFFILYMNLLGLVPFGATPTGNLAVTASLAILVFLVVEISGMLKLGFKGYLGTIFVQIPGLRGVGAAVGAMFMAPLEIISKLIKPFALAVRLFGNMTAGHFVILSLFGIVFTFGKLGLVSWGIGITTAVLVVGVMLLELIVGLLQAYVFALLSAVFIGLMQHEH